MGVVAAPDQTTGQTVLDAHRRAAAKGRVDFTDDAALAEWAGMTVNVFAGEPGNLRLEGGRDQRLGAVEEDDRDRVVALDED